MKIIGMSVILDEIQPKYFEKIIEWRNDPELNKYLNQPYKLTLDLQKKWYSEYLKDATQMLLVVLDKENGCPFGTLGWTNYSDKEKICTTGRTLVGNSSYRGSKNWMEATLLLGDYLHYDLDIQNVYSHICEENIASIKRIIKWGYKENKGIVRYPEELNVNGLRQKEYIRCVNDYNKIRDNMINIIYSNENII